MKKIMGYFFFFLTLAEAVVDTIWSRKLMMKTGAGQEKLAKIVG